MRAEISGRFTYDLARTVAGVRPQYRFDITCQGSVPEAMLAFFDAADVEEAIRLAVSLGGDADTQACIAGGIATAFWDAADDRLIAGTWARLPGEFQEWLTRFEERFCR